MPQVSQEVAWFVSAVLVEAALIDGWKLKVPNWLTFHMVLGGLAFATYTGGSAGLLWAFAGAVVGLALLLPLHAIGGMGAGDVKLMAGIGAWMGPSLTLGAFVVSAIVGGLMAIAMVVWSGQFIKHWVQFQAIGHEILDGSQSREALRDRGRTQANDDAPPLRYPDRSGLDCLLRLDRNSRLIC